MDRFSEVYRQYQQFKEQFQAGSLDKDGFQRAVEGLAFTDDQDQSWQIGVASGEWYKLQDGEWVKAEPPAPQAETPPPPPPSTPAEAPQYNFGDSATAPPPPPVESSPPPPPPTSSFDEAPQYDFSEPEGQAPKKTKKKKRRRGLIIGLILAVILLCVGTIYVGSQLLSSDETLIVIDNQTSYEICAVYISPTTSDEWGANWLSGNDTIPAFSSYSFTVEIGETFDVTADNCNGEIMDTLYEIYVPEEGITITYSPN